MAWLIVGLGGMFGAILRYEVSRVINRRFNIQFPYPTLLVNLCGAFLLGWFTSRLHAYFPQFGAVPMLFLGVGLCGAFTTFSTFSYEVIILLHERREWTALLYVIVSCTGGFALSAIGLFGLPQ